MPDGNAFKPYYHTDAEKMAHFLKLGFFENKIYMRMQLAGNFPSKVAARL